MPDHRILLVASSAEASKAYAQALTEIGVAFDIAPSFRKMEALAIDNAYNGLVVDLLTLVRSSREEKVIAYECLNLYPVLRVTWEPRQKRIKLSALEQTFSPDTEATLRFFIETRCKSFPARPLRRHKRKGMNLNLLLSTCESFSPHTTSRTFTTSVSMGGLFLHTLENFEEGRRIWLRFLELEDQSPIAATVRWGLPWGESRNVPGVGVRFEALSERQQRELQRLLKL